MKSLFVWGPGGVGKTHASLYSCFRLFPEIPNKQLITLDPSRRLFQLVGAPSAALEFEFQYQSQKCRIRAPEVIRLFDDLQTKVQAQPELRNFYLQMAQGLEDFRQYLLLILLADELRLNEDGMIIIDTPPFDEAQGLHRSIRHLQSFLGSSILKIASKSSQFSILQLSLKKILDLTKGVVGTATSERIFELLTWMSSHAERFQAAADSLHKLLASDETSHLFVLTPESSPRFLLRLKEKTFEKAHKIFLINRSCLHFPDNFDVNCNFRDEFQGLKNSEQALRSALKADFPLSPIHSIPYQLMGNDDSTELQAFLKSSL